MRRLFAEPDRCKGSHVELDEFESRHTAQVLRARVGDPFDVLDGAGHIHHCEVAELRKKSHVLKILSTETSPLKPQPITLFQAIPKGKVMDGIIQKATELGVARIVPILTERTVVDIDQDS